MGGGRRRDESLSISLSAFDKFSRYWARVRSRAGTTESRITYATARSRNRARGKKGGGGERQDPKSNVRNTRRGPGARGSRGASVTAAVNGRSRVEERGERGRGRRKRATEIFGTFVWRTIRGYRKKKPGRDIARTPVARSFRSRSSLAACEITEESYAHFTSQGERVPGESPTIPYRSRDRHCHHLSFLLRLLFLLLLLLFPHAAPSLQPSYFLQPL